MVKLIELLSPASVIAEMQARTRDQALAELVAVLPADLGLEAEPLVVLLREREEQSPTAIKDGIAVPHGRVPGLTRMVMCFGRSRAGLEFGAPDRQSTRFFFLLFAPAANTGGHLKALARIARLSRNPALREKLLAAGDGQSLFQALAEADRQLSQAEVPP